MTNRESQTAAENPSVACILLNWNGWKDTLACLRALSRSDYRNMSLLVIDNGSTDGSVEHIRCVYPDIRLIETGRNLGFGAGNNVGLRCALERGAEYVWLLNNDTEPHPGALTALVQKAGSNPTFGAVGSVMRYLHDPKTVQVWGGGRVNLWVGHSFQATSQQDDTWFNYITAASVLLRRRALEDIGLLDEGFFLYWEDGDLSFRLRKGGWTLGVAECSTVLHKTNGSTGRNFRVIDRHFTASGLRFLSKHSPAPWLSIPLFLSLRIGKRLFNGQFTRITDVTRGIRDYLLGRA